MLKTSSPVTRSARYSLSRIAAIFACGVVALALAVASHGRTPSGSFFTAYLGYFGIALAGVLFLRWCFRKATNPRE